MSRRVLQFPISKADIEKAVESITPAEVSRIQKLADRVWWDDGMSELVGILMDDPDTKQIGRAICHPHEHNDVELATALRHDNRSYKTISRTA